MFFIFQFIARCLSGARFLLPSSLLLNEARRSNAKPDLSEIKGADLENTRSVFAHIEQALKKNPHHPAILCMHQPRDHLSNLVYQDEHSDLSQEYPKCLAWTYTQIHETAKMLAKSMLARDVQPGSTLLMLIPNGGEYALLLWTCILMRLTFVSLDPALLDMSAQEELQDIVDSVSPSIVVVPDVAGSTAVDTALKQLPHLSQPRGISLNGSAPGWTPVAELLTNTTMSAIDTNSLISAARNDNPTRINSIMFTSGTSGRPKGCPQSVQGMTHVLHSQSWLINPSNCTRALQQAHNSRGIAPAQTLQTWREGGTVVMSSAGGFSEDEMQTAIADYGVTFIVLTPAMVHGMAQRLAHNPRLNIDSVRTVQVGGDAVTKDALRKCAAVFPNARVCINHGMTEGGGAFTWEPFFDIPVDEIPFFGEICPVGGVAPGASVRVWDAERGEVLPRGEPGELHISCGSLIEGYLQRVSAESFYHDEQGHWFNTGDVARMNRDGLVFILGRRKDMIRRRGVVIMPAALESCIEKMTGQQVCF